MERPSLFAQGVRHGAAVAALGLTAALVLGACSGAAPTSPTPVPRTSAGPLGTGVVPTSPASPSTSPTAKVSASAPPSSAGLTGMWSVSWQNETPDTRTGQFALVLGQEGSALNDTINMPADCNSGGDGTGTVTGSTVTFTVSCVPTCGNYRVSRFQYTGSISESTMSGTFAGGEGGGCPGWTGTWKATLQ